MPEDACQYFYKCKGCGVMMKPKRGDCCVFCSYGDVKCPTAQGSVRRYWKSNNGVARARSETLTLKGLVKSESFPLI